MNDKVYTKMLLRRRFCKRFFIVFVSFIISFYGSILLFGDLKTPRVINLTELDRCPACYGVSLCPELYSNQIMLDINLGWSSMFNAKNIYHGFTKSNRKVVLKKLAHKSEFKELDASLCGTWNLTRNCKPRHLLNVTNINDRIIQLVKYNFTFPDMEPRKGLVMCPYAHSLHDFIMPVVDKSLTNYNANMMNIWMMLAINPEPIILQAIPKSRGWPVPAYAGVCGRLEVVAHEGESLSNLIHIEWHKKLKYTQDILKAAMDFTYKHDRFRFYLMDWSLDNIVANENHHITFVDLEDIIILDKHTLVKKDLPHWYKRYARDIVGPGFTFSIENLCKHHLSDHNIWAACYLLAGDDNPFLYPIPDYVNLSKPQFNRLMKECLHGENRFKTIIELQRLIEQMLSDETIVGFGVNVR